MEHELGINLNLDDWRHIQMIPYKLIKSTKLWYTQYRITNKCLTTNIKQSKYIPEVTPFCTFCNGLQETVIHLLYECPRISRIWGALQIWFRRKEIDVMLSLEDVLFNTYDGQQKGLVNTIILIFKQYICAQKCLQLAPTFIGALTTVVKYQISKNRI